jgi:hypothetical protein
MLLIDWTVCLLPHEANIIIQTFFKLKTISFERTGHFLGSEIDFYTWLEISKCCSEMVSTLVYGISVSPLILDYNSLRNFVLVGWNILEAKV